MPRAQSPVSDQEEGNDALLLEELDRLKNEIRTLSNDKKKYEEEVQFKLRTQQFVVSFFCRHLLLVEFYTSSDEIKHFDDDNEDLNTQLGLAQSDQNKRVDDKNLDKLKDLNTRQDKLNAAIEEEKQAIQGLEYDVSVWGFLLEKE